jgi:hypothetical protein
MNLPRIPQKVLDNFPKDEPFDLKLLCEKTGFAIEVVEVALRYLISHKFISLTQDDGKLVLKKTGK